MGGREVVVRDPAVAVDAPALGPGIADAALVALAVIPDSHHGMAAVAGFTFDWARCALRW